MNLLTLPIIKVTLEVTDDFPNETTLEIGSSFEDIQGDKIIITEENQENYSFPFAIIDEQGEVLLGFNPNFTDYSLKVISEKMYIDVYGGKVTYYLTGDFDEFRINSVLNKIEKEMFNPTLLIADHLEDKVYECNVQTISATFQKL